jgi:hypothetical protein
MKKKCANCPRLISKPDGQRGRFPKLCPACKQKEKDSRLKPGQHRTPRKTALWLPLAKKMRGQGYTLRDIAKKVGVSYQRVCQALPGPLPPDQALAIRRRAMIQTNLRVTFPCPTCSRRRTRKKGVPCSLCCRRRYSTPETRRRNNHRNKKRRQGFIARGLCGQCGKNPLATMILCRKCADKMAEKQKQRLHRLNPDSCYYITLPDGSRKKVKEKP